MNGEALRRAGPVVDFDGGHDRAADQCRDVFALPILAMPGAHEPGVVIADHVETADAVKGEVVDEADRAAVVYREDALDQPRFSQGVEPQTRAVTTPCPIFLGGTAGSNDATS